MQWVVDQTSYTLVSDNLEPPTAGGIFFSLLVVSSVMVGSKKCYICGEHFQREDDIVSCDHCHVRFHRSCLEERDEDHCPRCIDEGWISGIEF
ncbi:RING finger protein [Natrinema caseinilyticum]|uniref:RING finger protein n=1 Tax=Natrinema caseinilyticum TaxID=2961570 RepID=UPI003CCCE613